MRLSIRVAVAILAGLLGVVVLQARPSGSGSGGSGGGHGGGGHGGGGHGGGGHGGFSAGHSGGGSVGHAIGHSLSRLFGRSGKATGSARVAALPLGDTRTLHDSLALPAAPHLLPPTGKGILYHGLFPRPYPRPSHSFPYFLWFAPRPGFGFGPCADFGFPPFPFLFDNGFNCAGGGFFFGPFLAASALPYGSAVNPAGGYAAGEEQGQDFAAPDPAYKSRQPVTLLQLRDGTMYGLTDYWVEGGELHYITTYGGQDAIALDRIDLEKTVQLNGQRGVAFVLRARPGVSGKPN
jgi:hypothetical protein